MDVVFYLKDTGYKTADLSTERDSWLVNNGEPIRIHVTDYTINSQSNIASSSVVDDFYYNPDVVSREMTKLTLQFYVIQDFSVNGTIYVYDKANKQFIQTQNPPVSSITALLEQFIGKNSHVDLFMSDSSGVTPDFFKTLPLYWLAITKSNHSDNITPEVHLNIKIISYTVSKASNKKYNVTVQAIVLQ